LVTPENIPFWQLFATFSQLLDDSLDPKAIFFVLLAMQYKYMSFDRTLIASFTVQILVCVKASLGTACCYQRVMAMKSYFDVQDVHMPMPEMFRSDRVGIVLIRDAMSIGRLQIRISNPNGFSRSGFGLDLHKIRRGSSQSQGGKHKRRFCD